MIKSVGLFGDETNLLATSAVEETINFMKRNKVECFTDEKLGLDHNPVNVKDLECDLVLCFGGDGELLKTFHNLRKKQIPVMGINCGQLGFMMDLDRANFLNYLPLIIKEKFHIQKRNRLEIKGSREKVPLALNEIVIAPSKPATVLRYGLNIDNEKLWRDNSDGIIISTPSGSTGYALSAGGPICSYNSDVMLIVPLNSLSETKPLVIPNKSKVEIFDIASRYGTEIIIDGQVRMKAGQKVEISAAGSPALLARMTNQTYSPISSKIREKICNLPNRSIRESAPPVKLILKVLESEGALTETELINKTNLPVSTVHRAVKELMDKELINKKQYIGDSGQPLYVLNV